MILLGLPEGPVQRPWGSSGVSSDGLWECFQLAQVQE